MSADAAAATKPTVQVVIVNYRTARLVVDCLRSLEPQVQAAPGTTVVVVDNASGDDSVPVLEAALAGEGWTGWAQLVAAPVNGGFAYGNNVAMQRALAGAKPPDLFWLLNPDTVAQPGSLRTLTEFMVAHPQVGICGGGIDEADGTPWSYAFRFPGILAEIDRGFAFGPVSKLLSRWSTMRRIEHQPERVDWVSGASMMLRAAAVRRLGPMDEGYFLYFEETDYCLRAARAGIECWYEPRSRIMHIAGQSTAVTAKTDRPARVPRYWFESRRRYFAKNHGRGYAILTDLAWMTAYVLGRARSWLQRKPTCWPPHVLGDFFRQSSLWHRHGAANVAAKAGVAGADGQRQSSK
jgi:N-acetylglucosaminyl-diphospho-decaprenol L-rhamnosyltransferase